jgi:hypothetical protein
MNTRVSNAIVIVATCLALATPFMAHTINDPKAYTRPWIAIDRMRFVQIPVTTDRMEMINAASEAQTVAANFKANEEKSRDAAK